MSDTRSSRQYINTMVFAIVAGILSLMLLVLVMTNDGVKDFGPFIITLEVGLILAIVWAIVRIIRYELKSDQANKNGFEAALRVNTCPDYWRSSVNSEGKIECTNKFNVGTDPDTYMTVLGKGVVSVTSKTVPVAEKMAQKVKISDYDNKTIAHVCGRVSNGNHDSVNSSWTDVKAVCSSYQI
jgi:hypothetical protein